MLTMSSLNWNLDAPPVADATLTTPECKLSTGMGEAGGGSLNGGAQLFLLNFEDYIHGGGAICGYLKGKDKRTMCLSKSCGMASHKNAGDKK
jgi:hypothetical protein